MADPASGMGDKTYCACGCGTQITSLDDRKRPRTYLRGHYMILAARIYRTRTVDAPAAQRVEITTMR